MPTAPHHGIYLAEGFHFTDHLDSPYQLAYSHFNLSRFPVYVSNVDGSERRELLAEDPTCSRRTTCFSPDGTTLYGLDSGFWAKDVQTGVVRTLPDIPPETPFELSSLLDCSPDNRTLLLYQQPKLVRRFGGPIYVPTRLCRVSTNGTNFRVLAGDSSDSDLEYAACCWADNAALVYRYHREPGSERFELCNMDLNTGELKYVCPASEWSQYGDLHSNSKESVWTMPGQELYTCSLSDCVTRKLPLVGAYPIWSPNGRQIAFVQDWHTVCLWDIERQCEQRIIGFTPSYRAAKEDTGFSAQPFSWSPDGRMFWFAIVKTRRIPNILPAHEVLGEHAEYLDTLPKPLNRKWIDRFAHKRQPEPTSLMGIVDLSTQHVMLYKGFLRGVTWLPRTYAETKA